MKHNYFLLFGTWLSRIITQGCILSLGVYYDSITNFLGSNVQTVVVLSTAQSLLEMTGICASRLARSIEARYLVMAGAVTASLGIAFSAFAQNFWQLILCLGILNGIGQGVARVLLPVALGFQFPDKTRHIAMAVANTGDGFGALLFPIFYEEILQAYTWKRSFLVISAVVLNLSVCGMTIDKQFLRQQRTALKANCDQSGVTGSSIGLLPNLPLLLMNLTIHSIGYSIFMTFIFSDLTHRNISGALASAMVSFIGAGSIFGRLAVAFMNNKRVPRWAIYAVMHVIRGAIVSLFNAVVTGPTRNIYYFLLCSAFGLTDGITGALIPLVGLDTFGLQRLSDTYSYQTASLGIGALIGLPIAGILKDHVPSTVDLALILSGVAFAVAGLVLLPFIWTKKSYQLLK